MLIGSSQTANPGDELIFQFEQKNHTATQSSFDNPCTFNGGFNSGFHPVSANQTDNFPTFTVPVKDVSTSTFSIGLVIYNTSLYIEEPHLGLLPAER